jgi:uncharacterized membrane protein
MKLRCVLLVAAALLLEMAIWPIRSVAQAPAPVTYDVVEIPPFGQFDSTVGTAISDNGIAAFSALGDNQDVPTNNGAICKYSVANGCAATDLGLLGDGDSGALARINAISRDGTFVVGTRQTERPKGPNQPFWQSTEGKLDRVDLLGLGGDIAGALGITSDGKRITGFGYDKDKKMFGILWEASTQKLSTKLPPLQADSEALAYGGTNGVFVAGVSARKAVSWGKAAQATELSSTGESAAVAANANFDILGTNFRVNKCALWPLKGDRIDFGALKFPAPKAINDSRLAVGVAMSAQGNHAILWDLSDLKNIQEIDLNNQIDAKLGWTLLVANGINSKGEIVGTGMLNKKWRGFILVPKKQ